METTLTQVEREELNDETTKTYQANNLIADKIVYPKSRYFGKKGESYYLKNGDQYYFKPKGEDDFIRVKWYYLDSIVGEGDYGSARYVGINASIVGKVGKLTYTNKKWIFHLETENNNGLPYVEKYTLNSPESVELLD